MCNRVKAIVVLWKITGWNVMKLNSIPTKMEHEYSMKYIGSGSIKRITIRRSICVVVHN